MDVKTHLVAQLNASHECLLGQASDLDGDHLVHQLFEGANHCLWVLGHTAVTDNMLVGQIDESGKVELEGYWEKFGMGSTPVADAAQYPTKAELLEVMAERRRTLLALVDGLDDAGLGRATTGPVKDFAPTIGELVRMIGWHEVMHAGQLSMVRRSLGFKPHI